MGLYMGLFNLSVVLPQLVVSLGVALMISRAPDKSIIFAISAASLALSTIAWSFVREDHEACTARDVTLLPRRSGTVSAMQTLIALVFVGAGSMLGGLSRYGLTLATQNLSAFSIPYGTLLSNLAGCLVIGIIAGFSGKTELMSTEMRLLLATGFCGGFTTMSSFIYELGQFVQDKEFFFASTYFVATLAGAASPLHWVC